MSWMLLPYRRYADFSGRSRRLEYWMFTLFQAIVITLFLVVMLTAAVASRDSGTGEFGAGFSAVMILFLIFCLGSVIPALAVTVRRLHDQDKSGWWILVQLLPFGALILLIFMCLEGTPGYNSYGDDPTGLGDADAFA